VNYLKCYAENELGWEFKKKELCEKKFNDNFRSNTNKTGEITGKKTR